MPSQRCAKFRTPTRSPSRAQPEVTSGDTFFTTMVDPLLCDRNAAQAEKTRRQDPRCSSDWT